MLKCCICGKEIQRAAIFACPQCYGEFDLALSTADWPEWAQSEKRREESRRRFQPGYGVDGSDLAYAPYDRHAENTTYRRVNNVRRDSKKPTRAGADNLLYSSRDDESPEEVARGYHRVLESMPSDLRERLNQHAELQAVLADAVRSLPLISQRALQGYLGGYSLEEMAGNEGVTLPTMRWLLDSAKERLADLLRARVGADNGIRFVPRR